MRVLAALAGLWAIFVWHAGAARWESRGSSKQVLKIRVFWVRHGLSCANVLQYKCSKDPGQVEDFFQDHRGELEASLRKHFGLSGARNGGAAEERRLGRNFSEQAQLDEGYKIKSSGADAFCGFQELANEDADPAKGPGVCSCMVERFPGDTELHEWMGKKSPSCAQSCQEPNCCGGIIPLHGLYQDPLLTDCAAFQSQQAGRRFLEHLANIGFPQLDFVGSSNLMRAMETAYNMFFLGPKGNETLESLVPAQLTPMPYMIEKHHGEHGFVQMDNIPFESEEQLQILQELHPELMEVLDLRFREENFPADMQHWEKFKAVLALELVPRLRPELRPAASLRPVLEEGALDLESHAGHRGAMSNGLHWTDSMKEHYSLGEDFDLDDYLATSSSPGLRELNVALVGHSQTMMEYCFREKPANNGIYEKLFILEIDEDLASTSRHVTMRELAADGVRLADGSAVGCREVMSVPEMVKDFEARDVQTCAKGPWNPLEILRLKQDSSGLSACERPFTEDRFAFPSDLPK